MKCTKSCYRLCTNVDSHGFSMGKYTFIPYMNFIRFDHHVLTILNESWVEIRLLLGKLITYK